jgi:phosphohistidine phosphatase
MSGGEEPRAYLVRHARPVDASVDPSQPLSGEGEREIGMMAAHLAGRGDVFPERIIHSGKKRARQTAETLAEALDPPGGVSEEKGLGPNDDSKVWGEYLGSNPGTMLVGHMPFLGELSCEMTGGEVCGWKSDFRTAEVACFERLPGGRWELLWHVSPEDI